MDIDIELLKRTYKLNRNGELDRIDSRAGRPVVGKRKSSRVMIDGKYYCRKKITWALAYGEPLPKNIYFAGDTTSFALSNLVSVGRTRRIVNRKR